MRGRPQKHLHYAGNNRYTAPCGHLVRKSKTLRCWACHAKHEAACREERIGSNRISATSWIASDGYVIVQRGSRQVPEHRIVAERALGRPLRATEVVHHVNGDKTDNRPSNLLICSNSYHRWLHNRMSELFQREKFVPKPQEVA